MKKLLLLALLFFIAGRNYGQVSPNDSLKLYYPFNEIYSMYVSDESGNNNRGLAYHVEPAKDRFGQLDKALYFKGDSYVKFNADSFAFPEYTYSAWLKLNNQPPEGTAYFIINIGSAYAVDQHIVYTNNYSFFNLYGFTGQGYNTDGSTSWVTQNNIVEISTWNFVVYTRDSKIAKLYVNGELIDSTNVQWVLPVYGDTVKGFVGCRNNYSQYTKAYIDDVRIYSYAIDKETVSKLYLLDISGVDSDITKGIPLVYPNPAESVLHVDLPNIVKQPRILVYNTFGVFVKHFENTNDLFIDDLPSGLYFLKVTDELSDYETVVKFVKY